MCAVGLARAADTHIYAGARGTNVHDQLQFSNGVLFDAGLTNFSFAQILRTNGLNAGHYRGDVITFASLAGTAANGGPIPGHAAFGARLAIQVVSVEGPEGGSFAFWEGDGESSLPNITFSVPVGETNGSNHFLISENSGEIGADPYGHFHGRQFTTSAPGTYLVRFRVIDVSTNGAGGGPIHLPSDVLKIRFQAGLRIQALQTFSDRTTMSFRSLFGITNVLESIDSLGADPWRTTAPLRGNNNLQTFTDTNAPAEMRFYRLRTLNNLP
jgi:hypothetical protein